MKTNYNRILYIIGLLLISVILFYYIYQSVLQNKSFEPFNQNNPSIVLGFLSYPRNGIDTPRMFERTLNSLIENKQIKFSKIKIIIVGDDYPTIYEQLEPILKKYKYEYEIIDINKQTALRNKGVPKNVVWMHACTRSVIQLMEKCLENSNEYDYMMLSSDDDLYINDTINTYYDYIMQYNKPDLVFALGLHFNNETLPRTYDKTNLMKNYPEAANTIASGVLYSLKNRKFIKDIIEFRKSRWGFVESCIQKNDFSGIEPEDLEVWNYLKPKFENKEYTSLLVPITLTSHDTEMTIMNYI